MHIKLPLAFAVFLICLSGCGLKHNQDYKNLKSCTQWIMDADAACEQISQTAGTPVAKKAAQEMVGTIEALHDRLGTISKDLSGTTNGDIGAKLTLIYVPLKCLNNSILKYGPTRPVKMNINSLASGHNYVLSADQYIYFMEEYLAATKSTYDIIHERIREMRKDYGE